MSNIYIQEPPTNGKVLLKTTAGDIDVELWAKEAPKACRNFVQLCLEGYYDNTIFHRVVPEFIVQGGDPTGTGSGGESIYGKPFRDEFHSRLRFIRRGLVAMANAGPHDNGSQFFFTLGRADELNNKHTIFGKVTGDTIYNLLRLTEVDIGEDERPVNPHKIKTSEVLFNPFDDIIPRVIKKPKKEKQEEENKKPKVKGTKNFKLLSFGEEAEEEEEEVNKVSETMKGKSKSSHDLLKDDPRLSSVPAIDRVKNSSESSSDTDEDAGEEDEMDSDERHQMKDRISSKLKKGSGKGSNATVQLSENLPEKKSSRSEELRKESRQLKRELKAAKQKKEEDVKVAEEPQEAEKPVADDAIEEYLKEKEKYEERKKKNTKKGSSREEQTLAMLDQFKSKLNQAISETPEEEVVSETEVEDDKGWLSHVLQFDENEKGRKVKDATIQDEDTFEIYDPRNPVNKRRREESKKLMKQKKERR
ncbi:spliceosome-associated protein CWC27 homolog isoform 2-T2 [Pelodytes ibericus]